MRAVIARDKVLRMVERAVPVPSGSEVLVKIAYAGVNRADLLQKDGHYPPPAGASDIIGLECSGMRTVEKIATIANGLDSESFLDFRRLAVQERLKRWGTRRTSFESVIV